MIVHKTTFTNKQTKVELDKHTKTKINKQKTKINIQTKPNKQTNTKTN